MKAILPSGYRCKKFYGYEDVACLEAIGVFRYDVWKQEGVTVATLLEGQWLDKFDKYSYHWAVFEDHTDELVASARLLPCESFDSLPYEDWYTNLSESPVGEIGHLGRDVVALGHRGKGLGHYLNIVREQKAIELGIQSLIADIPDYRHDAFARLGFREVQAAKPGTILPDIRWAVVLKNLDASPSKHTT